MATLYGSLAAFDHSREDWSSYILRLKFYFQANGVDDAGKKKSILLTTCGTATLNRISSLFTVAQLDAINYDDLVTKVTKFYEPKPSTIVQRFKFNS